jgi:nucleotide-binding universal stress UspA family protein
VRYHTILAYLEDEHVFKRPLAYARTLAEAQGAHLIGLTVMPAFNEVPAAATRIHRLIDEYRLSFRDEAERMKEVFEKPAAITMITTEWRMTDTGFRPRLETVAALSSGADLLIACQDDGDGSSLGYGDNAGMLVTLSHRPVILTPRHGGPWDAPRSIVVACNGSAESSRAVFDALPLLTAAESVTVIAIRSLEERSNGVFMRQLDDLCASLSRHGVKVDCRLEVPEDGGDGPTILTAAQRHGAELLVMGGYGHSRLGESIFGGVTRHILANMRTPVLLSH